MGDDEDDVRYPPNLLGSDSSHGQKLDVRSAAYAQPVGNRYVDDEEDGEEEDYEEEDPGNGVQRLVMDVGSDGDDDESDGEGPDNGVQHMDSDDDDSDSNGEDGVYRNEKQNGYDLSVEVEDVDVARHPKKRKMKSLISSYEFAPRVPAPVPLRPAPTPPAPKPSSGGRNSLTDWTERETLVLLDAWGDRFLRRGRKSLRFEEWQEVTEKVSEVSRIERTDTQCRNRLDTLKKKYKKEKTAESSKWVYFKKMDMLMSSSPLPSSPPQRPGLSCGLDSGGYVFVNPRMYLNRANGLNEMRDSPDDDSESTEGDNDSDGLPPKKRRSGRDKENNEGSSVRMLADCIYKFSSIYEKTENNKRKQMAELEKMRMDFHRDLEMQKRQIIERAKAEIARIQEENENA